MFKTVKEQVNIRKEPRGTMTKESRRRNQDGGTRRAEDEELILDWLESQECDGLMRLS